jgi:hypothetical protein
MLDTVFVARDETAADFAVVSVLPFFIEDR